MPWGRWSQTSGYVVAPIERSNGNGSWTDVTGASLTLPIAADSVTLVALTCSLKVSDTSTIVGVRTIAGSGYAQGSGFDKGATSSAIGNIVADGTGMGANTYIQYGIMDSVHSAVSGTGAKTVKVQFYAYKPGGGGTGYIKDVYLTAFNMPYNS